MALKKNFTYSLILTLSTYLVPLLVFPYISRVLGPSGIGAVDTVESIINYCVMFSMMGLTTIGIREIAISKGDGAKLKEAFSSLFTLNLITTVFVGAVLLLLVFLIPEMRQRKEMFFIGILKLLFNLVWIEWFFKGIESFRYITIRTVLLRVCFIIAVFCLVRKVDDYITYYMLWVSITVGNALCNWFYRRRYTAYSFSAVRLKKYTRPFFLLGLFAVFSAVYTQLNVSFLGFVCGEEQVGYYTTATRLYSVIIALFSSLTAVMIPRMSVLIKENDMESIKTLYSKVFKLLFLFAFPVVVFMEFFPHEFISLFAGSGFDGAIMPMRIVIPLIFVIGSEQIFILQILIPLGKDKHILVCAIGGALTCAVMNIFLVHSFMAVGSALSWVAAECVVFIISEYFVRRFIGLTFPFRIFFRCLLYSMGYVVIALVVRMFITDETIRIVVVAIPFIVYTVIVEEYFLKLAVLKSFYDKFLRCRLERFRNNIA